MGLVTDDPAKLYRQEVERGLSEIFTALSNFGEVAFPSRPVSWSPHVDADLNPQCWKGSEIRAGRTCSIDIKLSSYASLRQPPRSSGQSCLFPLETRFFAGSSSIPPAKSTTVGAHVEEFGAGRGVHAGRT